MKYTINDSTKLINNVVTNKVVFLRADLNLPKTKDNIVSDTYRLDNLMPTLKYLVENKAKIILATHIGNPKEKNEKFSTKFLIQLIKDKIDCDITHCDDCIGDNVDKIINFKNYGDIILLENLRFHKEEKLGDIEFAHKLTHLSHIYINEAFSCCHRNHASISKVPESIKHVAGFNIEKEITTLTNIFNTNTEKKKTFIIGGSKLSTKIKVIENAMHYAQNIIILGGMANLFILAQGKKIGKSFVEMDMIEKAKDILKRAKNRSINLFIPENIISTTEISETSHTNEKTTLNINDNEMIVDIGPEDVTKIKAMIENSDLIVWNGPAGIIEYENFSKGTLSLAKNIMQLKDNTEIIIGGGDILSCLTKEQKNNASFISTGGGAFLDFISNQKMPGIDKLLFQNETK